MEIEKVQQPVYRAEFNDKERLVLKDIFGNMSDYHLRALCGNAEHSKFVLEFYSLLYNA